MANKILLFVKNFVFGFVIYGIVTTALSGVETASFLYQNLTISRQLLNKATIALVDSTAFYFVPSGFKSKLLAVVYETVFSFKEKPRNISMSQMRVTVCGRGC